jgi:hypothetical protein
MTVRVSLGFMNVGFGLVDRFVRLFGGCCFDVVPGLSSFPRPPFRFLLRLALLAVGRDFALS